MVILLLADHGNTMTNLLYSLRFSIYYPIKPGYHRLNMHQSQTRYQPVQFLPVSTQDLCVQVLLFKSTFQLQLFVIEHYKIVSKS